MTIIRRLYGILFSAVRTGAEVCLFGMIGLLVVDVFGRYVVHKSTLISYDMTAYFLVGITYLAAAYGLREGSHVRVSVVIDRFSPAFQRAWYFFVDLVALVFTVILLWKSLDLVRFNIASGVRASTFMGEPLWIPQVIVPIGLALFVIEEATRLMISGWSMLGWKTKEQLAPDGGSS